MQGIILITSCGLGDSKAQLPDDGFHQRSIKAIQLGIPKNSALGNNMRI